MAMTSAEKTQKHSEDYRQWIANGTDEQKELWARERQIHNKPQYRAEYMEIVNRLQDFVPLSPETNGKYGREEVMDDKEYKIHLRGF